METGPVLCGNLLRFMLHSHSTETKLVAAAVLLTLSDQQSHLFSDLLMSKGSFFTLRGV